MVGNHAWNRFDGWSETVVQAGSIHGDVYLPAPQRSVPPPFHIPGPTRHYTNSERQLAEIDEAVARTAEPTVDVVVVQGPPGGGKTETVLRWIDERGVDYPDGQFHVSLRAGTAESGLESSALRRFLLAVGYESDGIPDTVEGRSTWFQAWSRGKRIAVVIDDALTPSQVRRLLPGPGSSVVLVTEAGRLNGLRVREAATFVELDPMSAPSARLLLERIVDDDRVHEESDQVDELVRICDGSTIALCVSGALLVEFPERPVARLVDELSRQGRRLAKLSGDEELSVTAVFDTALGRLGEGARRCYLALGQHPGAGEVGLQALAVALDQDIDDTQDALDLLLTTRLVRETPQGRYVTDSLVREHASGRAELDDERAAEAVRIRDGFAWYYLHNAIAAAQVLMPQRGWLSRLWPGLVSEPPTISEERAATWLETERSNLRALAEREYAAGTEVVCQLAVALWPSHERGKHLDDLDIVNGYAAEVAEYLDLPLVRALALVQRGFAFRHRGESDKAADLFGHAETSARHHGYRDLEATAVESLGLIRREQRRFDEARRLLRHNLERARELDVPRRTALARMHLGSVEALGDALPLLDEALHGFRHLPNPDEHNAAKTLLWSGKRLTEQGEFVRAAVSLEEAMRFLSDHGLHFDVAQAHQASAELAVATGDGTSAREHFTEALAIYRVRGFVEQAEGIRSRLGELD